MVYFGIDIGGTGIKAGVVSPEGKLLYKQSAPTQAALGYEVLAKDIADLIKSVMENQNISLDDVAAIGLGCPGSIDDKNGVVIYANNINLKNAPLCAQVRKYIDKPVYIGNDANCAALGEYFAMDDDSIEDFVAVTLGTGVGGGIIINKKIQQRRRRIGSYRDSHGRRAMHLRQKGLLGGICLGDRTHSRRRARG